jgi:hypothetical protein
LTCDRPTLLMQRLFYYYSFFSFFLFLSHTVLIHDLPAQDSRLGSSQITRLPDPIFPSSNPSHRARYLAVRYLNRFRHTSTPPKTTRLHCCATKKRWFCPSEGNHTVSRYYYRMGRFGRWGASHGNKLARPCRVLRDSVVAGAHGSGWKPGLLATSRKMLEDDLRRQLGVPRPSLHNQTPKKRPRQVRSLVRQVFTLTLQRPQTRYLATHPATVFSMGLRTMAQHRQAPRQFKEEPGHDSVSATFFFFFSCHAAIHPSPTFPRHGLLLGHLSSDPPAAVVPLGLPTRTNIEQSVPCSLLGLSLSRQV